MPPDPDSPPAPSRSGRGGRLFAAATALSLLLLLPGCRVDATVEARVHGRSGEVTARFALDQEAVAVLGGNVDLAAGAQVADLKKAGWVITGPRHTQAAGAVMEASKGFGRPEDLARVVSELSGPAGPLQGFRLERRHSLTRARYRLSGVADLRGGVAATGFENAPGLAERVRGAGVDPKRLEELLTSRAADGFRLRVVVDLPGGEERAWDVPLGQRVEIEASSTAPDRARPALLALAAVLALAAAAVAAGRRRPLPPDDSAALPSAPAPDRSWRDPPRS